MLSTVKLTHTCTRTSYRKDALQSLATSMVETALAEYDTQLPALGQTVVWKQSVAFCSVMANVMSSAILPAVCLMGLIVPLPPYWSVLMTLGTVVIRNW